MSTTHAKRVADWLAAHPAPVHKADISAWGDQVRSELGDAVLEDLIGLLADGDLEQQYQAMAAARVLGADVWAEGEDTDMVWLVKLPHDKRQHRIRPGQRLAG